MRQLGFAATALVTMLWGTASAQALSCQQRLIAVGDSSARVMQLCGEPAEIVQRTESRSRVVQRRAADGTIIADTVTVTVVLEHWTYDFGPRRFMRRLVFEEGVLVRLSTLGYGTAGRSPRKKLGTTLRR